MNIGFITIFDLNDKKAWSGTINFLYRTISKKHNVYPIITRPFFFQKVIHKFQSKLCKKIIIINKMDLFLNCIRTNRAIKRINNIVDCFFSTESIIVGLNLNTNKKIYLLNDATAHLLINYYRFGFDTKCLNLLDELQLKGLRKSSKIIFSSDWAKKDAIDYYKIPSEKIHVLKFGANIIDEYKPKQLINKNCFSFLFVGVEWKRKGADIAIKTIQYLNRKSNYKFKLSIVGLNKPDSFNDDSIVFFGRLMKDNPEQYSKLIELYKIADCFILPTIAECAGIVFSEASMYGLPIFTHKTGGVESYVKDYETGRCLELGSTEVDFGDAVLDMIKNNKYKEWAVNARLKYEEELNWNKWEEDFNKII